MAKKYLIALFSCAFALCLALVGCGDNGASAKAAFTGTWDLVEMSQGDQVTGSDELETLKSLGLEVYVNLNEDGKSALVLFGEVIDGTWEANSTTEGTITMEGQQVSMKIADSKLTFEQEGAKLTFQKGQAKEVPSKSSSAESAASSDSSASSESASAASTSAESASADSASASAESASASAASASAESASAASASAESDSASSASASSASAQ